ncbi:MFS transporter [Herbaspirillum lusitanum]|uniref:MFS transporter n=1 Tax=Herbaspirillum lusitanum TaxID=213312 RepID=A0ABW9AA82_9BURK
MPSTEQTLKAGALLNYGAFGLPLTMAALPLYMFVPAFYQRQFGLSLALIGAALLSLRMADALIDPLLGAWVDRGHEPSRYRRLTGIALLPLALGFVALFQPPQQWLTQSALALAPLYWLLASTALCYFGFSLGNICHQSWGAALTQQPGQRTRLAAAREGAGLLGVVLASIVPALVGMPGLSGLFLFSLVLGAWLLLRRAPLPARVIVQPESKNMASGWRAALSNQAFRRLLAVFVLNGIAAAIPATLFLFFVGDRLQAANWAGPFLLLYFVSAALSMPGWVRLANSFGEARSWLLAMLLAVAVFIWSWQLPAAALWSFGLICILSGCAAGADLVLPPAMLTGIIARAGHSGRREGSYFGLWNCASKLNLALAAGLALPLLDYLGYTPGSRQPAALAALSFSYALLPCLLKLLAAALLWRMPAQAKS